MHDQRYLRCLAAPLDDKLPGLAVFPAPSVVLVLRLRASLLLPGHLEPFQVPL